MNLPSPMLNGSDKAFRRIQRFRGDAFLTPENPGRSRPRWPAPLVEPGAVFAHLLALRRRRVALAG
jgi:hypothetical protein